MNNFDLIPVHNELMMDSRDIASVTGKSVGHVNRDIRNMFNELYGDNYLLDKSKKYNSVKGW